MAKLIDKLSCLLFVVHYKQDTFFLVRRLSHNHQTTSTARCDAAQTSIEETSKKKKKRSRRRRSGNARSHRENENDEKEKKRSEFDDQTEQVKKISELSSVRFSPCIINEEHSFCVNDSCSRTIETERHSEKHQL